MGEFAFEVPVTSPVDRCVGPAPPAPARSGPARSGAAPIPKDRDPETPAVLFEGMYDHAPAYFSQRDNKFAGKIGSKRGVSADSECNVTTLAMQLAAVAGGIEPVNQRTIELLRAAGARPTAADMKRQPEDLLLELFRVRGDGYWKQQAEANPDFFPPSFTDEYTGNKTVGWHQISHCLNWTAREYPGVGAASVTGVKTDAAGGVIDDHVLNPEYFLGTLGPVLHGGGSVMLSTKLTGGHIVLLSGVEDDGIRIHDPFGMRLDSGYVKNGTADAARVKREAATMQRRLKHNPELLAAASDRKAARRARGNWGQDNFYSWDEVHAFQIGKWNSVLEKKKE